MLPRTTLFPRLRYLEADLNYTDLHHTIKNLGDQLASFHNCVKL